MPGAAEDRAVTSKCAGLVGDEVDLAGCTLANINLNIEISKTEAVRNIRALQHQIDGLTFLQSDLCGHKLEAFRDDFYMAG